MVDATDAVLIHSAGNNNPVDLRADETDIKDGPCSTRVRVHQRHLEVIKYPSIPSPQTALCTVSKDKPGRGIPSAHDVGVQYCLLPDADIDDLQHP